MNNSALKAKYIGKAPVNDYNSPAFERFENRQVEQGISLGFLEGCFFWTPDLLNLFIVLPRQKMFRKFRVTRGESESIHVLSWDGNLTAPTIRTALRTVNWVGYLERGYLREM